MALRFVPLFPLAALTAWGVLVVFGMPSLSSAAATPSVFLATNGSDSNSCSQAAPCKTFNRAYQVANWGDTIQVAAGTYPGQTINAKGGESGAASYMVFQPAGTVNVSGELRVAGAAYVEFDNMQIGDFYTGINDNTSPIQTHHVIFRNDTIGIFYITGASYVSILGGSVGPAVNDAAQVKSCYLCTTPPQHIVIDGVNFHDFTRTTTGIHMECMQIYPVWGMQITHNRFRNCAIFDIHLSGGSSCCANRDVTIEDNLFDIPGSVSGGVNSNPYPLRIGTDGHDMVNILVRNNSFVGTLLMDNTTGGSFQNVQVIGNVGETDQQAFCSSGVTYAYNVWTGAKCSSTDVQAATGYTNRTALDLHLTSGAAAIDLLPLSAGCAADDYEGNVRPAGPACDSGAYEVGAASRPTTTSTTTPTTTTTPSGSGLVGDQTLEASSDIISSGTAEAYSYAASQSGSVDTANVYVRSRTTATKVAVGIYAAIGSHPGALLASCSFTPAGGTWNSCSATAGVTSRTTYWIALLPTGGKLDYAAALNQASETNAARHLRSLPATWTTGSSYTHGPASTFFDSTAPVR